MRKGLTAAFMLVASIFFLDAIEAYPVEQVVQLRRSYKEVGNQNFCESEAACNSSLFEVYTAQEMNGMMDQLNGRIDSVARQVGTVDQKINAAESRITAQVRHVLDTMPQLLLSDQARDAIQSAVMSVEKDELSKIRRDMQKQIDELKRQIENLKRNK